MLEWRTRRTGCLSRGVRTSYESYSSSDGRSPTQHASPSHCGDDVGSSTEDENHARRDLRGRRFVAGAFVRLLFIGPVRLLAPNSLQFAKSPFYLALFSSTCIRVIQLVPQLLNLLLLLRRRHIEDRVITPDR